MLLPHRIRTFAILALVVAVLCGVQPAANAAVGGSKFLPAAETALATVLATVRNVHKLDQHGCTANLAVEHVVARGAGLRVQVIAGSEIMVVWEELAANRPVRFADGQRVLVALSPFPSASIWLQRVPALPERQRALGIAADGDAFLIDPDPPSTQILGDYLALRPERRHDTPGLDHLMKLLADGSGDLPIGALASMRGVEALAGKLSPAALAMVESCIAGSSSNRLNRSVRAEAIALVAQRQVVAMLPALRRLARPGFDLEAEAWAAIAEIAGGLTLSEIELLLVRPEAELRVAAVRLARQSEFRDRLAVMVRSDHAPSVRAAAAQALIVSGGVAVADQVYPALGDPDASVVLAAARALGHLGDVVVPGLTAIVANGSEVEAKGAILALNQAGASGRDALLRISVQHPNEKIRNLALLALGRVEGEKH